MFLLLLRQKSQKSIAHRVCISNFAFSKQGKLAQLFMFMDLVLSCQSQPVKWLFVELIQFLEHFEIAFTLIFAIHCEQNHSRNVPICMRMNLKKIEKRISIVWTYRKLASISGNDGSQFFSSLVWLHWLEPTNAYCALQLELLRVLCLSLCLWWCSVLMHANFQVNT